MLSIRLSDDTGYYSIIFYTFEKVIMYFLRQTIKKTTSVRCPFACMVRGRDAEDEKVVSSKGTHGARTMPEIFLCAQYVTVSSRCAGPSTETFRLSSHSVC
jgi:hypothetical protein